MLIVCYVNFQGCRPYNVVSHLLLTSNDVLNAHTILVYKYLCLHKPHTVCRSGDDMGLMPLNNSPDAILFAIKCMMERGGGMCFGPDAEDLA